MITLLRKLIAILRGGAGTREILLGLMIGYLIGMVPGFNLTLVLCILLVLVLNANVGVISLGLLAGKISCLLLAPFTFELGFTMIHSLGMEGLVRTVSDTPVLALLDLDHYCLIGGLPIGIVGGLLLGFVVSWAITKIRKKIVDARKDNEKLETLLSKWYIKLLIRVLAGKKPKKGDMAAALDKESPLLRKSGLIVAGSALALIIVIDLLVLKFGSTAILESALGSMNGAEVNIEKADISIFSGKANLTRLQITDPKNPSNNLAVAEGLTADFSVSDLLTKRFVAERVIVDTIQMDVPRQSPGEVYVDVSDDDDDGDKGVDGEESDATQLVKIIENWEDYQRYMKKGKEYIDNALEARKKRKQLMAAGDPKQRLKALKELAKQYGYFRMNATLWLADKPTWELRELRAGGLNLGDMLPPQDAVISNVSNAPDLKDEPISMALVDADNHETFGCDIKINDDLSNSYEIRCDLKDIAVNKVNLGDSVPVTVKEGKGQATGKGTLTAGKLALPFGLNLSELNLDVDGDKDVMGMKPDTAREVFAAVNELGISGEVLGSMDNIRVKIDYEALRDTLSEALKKAGKDMLVKKMNEEVDRAKAKATDEADKAIDKEVDKLKGKYGKEVSDKIGAENYKKLEGVIDNVDSKTLSDTAGKIMKGLGKGEESSNGNETKKPEGNSGDSLKDAAGGALNKLLKDDDNKADDEKDPKKKKKKSLLDAWK